MEREDMRETKDLIRAILTLDSEAAQDMSVIFAMGVEAGAKIAEAAARKQKEEEEEVG